MGAQTFISCAKGKTAAEAFTAARAAAQWERGHGGYTGTVAEKHEFVVIDVPAGVDPGDHARALIENDDQRIYDKWGPAGCVKLPDGEWIFFGWASC